MSKIQLERLQKDLIELDTYIEKVKRKGKNNLVAALTKKRDFLSSRLTETS